MRVGSTILPDIMRGLERDWSIEVGRSFDEGTEAFVAEVQMADGDGCPILSRDDPVRGALLMERLGSSMFSLGLPYEQRLPILCDAASRMWAAGDRLRTPDRRREGGVADRLHHRDVGGPRRAVRSPTRRDARGQTPGVTVGDHIAVVALT